MQRRVNYGRWLLLAVILLPLLSMWLIPLSDTSEPRYAEIARLMAQTGDWITPWFSPGVPFWGKPPMSFWGQALSMKVLGVSAFAARLPSWLCLLGTLYALYLGLRRLRGQRVALWACIIYTTSALAYISSGAVLTDPFLALGTTLSFICFAVVIGAPASAQAGQPFPLRVLFLCRYGFFVGLAIGLLSKGPLAAVLIGVPTACWLVLDRRRCRFVSVLPWISGLLLTIAISLPWYLLAENKTPGFLDYFIVGEHIRRFLDSGWNGDMYGTAHKEVFGTIWLFWLEATFPWGLAVLAVIAASWRSMRLRTALTQVRNDPLFSYWLAWALFTPVFFTVSANILWTYILPAIAPFSVLASLLFEQLRGQQRVTPVRLLLTALLVPVAIFIWTQVAWLRPDSLKSERGLVHYALQQGAAGIPLSYLNQPPFSARFYSAGKVQAIDLNTLAADSANDTPAFVAISKGDIDQVASLLGHPLAPVYENRRFVLIETGPHIDRMATKN